MINIMSTKIEKTGRMFIYHHSGDFIQKRVRYEGVSEKEKAVYEDTDHTGDSVDFNSVKHGDYSDDASYGTECVDGAWHVVQA